MAVLLTSGALMLGAWMDMGGSLWGMKDGDKDPVATTSSAPSVPSQSGEVGDALLAAPALVAEVAGASLEGEDKILTNGSLLTNGPLADEEIKEGITAGGSDQGIKSTDDQDVLSGLFNLLGDISAKCGALKAHVDYFKASLQAQGALDALHIKLKGALPSLAESVEGLFDIKTEEDGRMIITPIKDVPHTSLKDIELSIRAQRLSSPEGSEPAESQKPSKESEEKEDGSDAASLNSQKSGDGEEAEVDSNADKKDGPEAVEEADGVAPNGEKKTPEEGEAKAKKA